MTTADKPAGATMNEIRPLHRLFGLSWISQLFAVCARYPSNLERETALTRLRDGVYEVRALGRPIRIIVASQLPQEEHNAMLHLFSARLDLLRYGEQHYRPHSPETSSLLYELFSVYGEDPEMPDKLKEFYRETVTKLLASLPAEERLKGLPAEERLKGLPAEELRKHLPVAEILKGMSAEEVAKALPPETLAALARQLKNGTSATP